MGKPVLFVTRRLPASIEALAVRDYDARLTPSDVAIADLLVRAEGADALLCWMPRRSRRCPVPSG